MTALFFMTILILIIIIVAISYKVGYNKGGEDFHSILADKLEQRRDVMGELYNQEINDIENMPKEPISEDEKVRLREKYKLPIIELPEPNGGRVKDMVLTDNRTGEEICIIKNAYIEFDFNPILPERTFDTIKLR